MQWNGGSRCSSPNTSTIALLHTDQRESENTCGVPSGGLNLFGREACEIYDWTGIPVIVTIQCDGRPSCPPYTRSTFPLAFFSRLLVTKLLSLLPRHLYRISLASCTVLLLAIAAACVPGEALAESKPNIVLILADDLGWSDTTLFGTTKFYKTPEHRTTGRPRDDVHPRLLGQPAVFADTGEYPDGTQPGPDRDHLAGVPPAEGRVSRRPRVPVRHPTRKRFCPTPSRGSIRTTTRSPKP